MLEEHFPWAKYLQCLSVPTPVPGVRTDSIPVNDKQGRNLALLGWGGGEGIGWKRSSAVYHMVPCHCDAIGLALSHGNPALCPSRDFVKSACPVTLLAHEAIQLWVLFTAGSPWKQKPNSL
jgi:hypothetical protein